MPSSSEVRARQPSLARRLTSSNLRGVPSGRDGSKLAVPSPLDAVHQVTETQQIFREIGAVLSGDTGDQRDTLSFATVFDHLRFALSLISTERCSVLNLPGDATIGYFA